VSVADIISQAGSGDETATKKKERVRTRPSDQPSYAAGFLPRVFLVIASRGQLNDIGRRESFGCVLDTEFDTLALR
jgi:hypothetical protein